MSHQEVYDAWRERSRQVDMAESFADQVMNHVYQYQKDRSKQFLRWLVGVVSEHPLAQASFVAVGAVTGLIRVAFVVCMFLRT